jgi:sulfur relay (sulfurtransferase) DsrC/TusE family protein
VKLFRFFSAFYDKFGLAPLIRKFTRKRLKNAKLKMQNAKSRLAETSAKIKPDKYRSFCLILIEMPE